MRHRINNLFVFGTALFYLCSCGHESQGSKVDDSNTVQSVPPPSDTAFPKDFAELKSTFVMDSAGRYDQNRAIRAALLVAFLKDDLDTAYPKTFTPLQMIENRSGYFFILRENCAPGGDCAYYWLLLFSKNGQIVGHRQLGERTAEEDEATLFSYEVIGDSSLVTKEVDNQIEKRKIDSTIKRIRLTL
jgi:hypothetical protein